eukprot:scaffold6371_cov110-Isochrysis_galbana.AAC.10
MLCAPHSNPVPALSSRSHVRTPARGSHGMSGPSGPCTRWGLSSPPPAPPCMLRIAKQTGYLTERMRPFPCETINFSGGRRTPCRLGRMRSRRPRRARDMVPREWAPSPGASRERPEGALVRGGRSPSRGWWPSAESDQEPVEPASSRRPGRQGGEEADAGGRRESRACAAGAGLTGVARIERGLSHLTTPGCLHPPLPHCRMEGP